MHDSASQAGDNSEKSITEPGDRHMQEAVHNIVFRRDNVTQSLLSGQGSVLIWIVRLDFRLASLRASS